MDLVRVFLLGEESAGAQVLKTLSKLDCTVVGAASRARDGPVAQACARLNVQFMELAPEKPSLVSALEPLAIDIVLNVHSLYLFDSHLLNLPLIGCFNLHPGPLPRYAGLTTVNWAIFNSEPSFGSTLHWMSERIDAGDIAYQAIFDVEPDTTPLALMSRSVSEGLVLVERLISDSHRPSSIPRHAQDLSERTYFGKAPPLSLELDWHLPARTLERFIRACNFEPFPSPWGTPHATINGNTVQIRKARLVENVPAGEPGSLVRTNGGQLVAICGEGGLELERIRVAGKPIPVRKFVRKLKDRLR